jgi:probable lipoprotein NlpC
VSSWAEKYLGIPFRDASNGPDAYDCWGLACLVYREQFRIELPGHLYEPETTPGALEEKHRIVESEKPNFRQLPAPQDGALVLYHIEKHRPHIGVCVGATDVLHMTRGQGAVILGLNHRIIRNGLVGFYLPNPR